MVHLPKTLNGLPRLCVTDRKNLPKTAGIYFVFDGRKVLYIGSAKNIHGRWVRHHQWKKIKDSKRLSAYSIAWIHAPEWNLLHYEQACINRFDPKWNAGIAQSDLYQRDKSEEKAIRKAIIRHHRKVIRQAGYRFPICPHSAFRYPKYSGEDRQEARAAMMIYDAGSWNIAEHAMNANARHLECLYENQVEGKW